MDEGTRGHVFDYRLIDRPQVWRIVVCPGDGLEEATRIVEDQFGAEQVLAVRAHLPAAGG